MSSASSPTPTSCSQQQHTTEKAQSNINLQNPVPFAEFRRRVLAQPYDQLYKYRTNDGDEVDLQETFDGGSSADESDENNVGDNYHIDEERPEDVDVEMNEVCEDDQALGEDESQSQHAANGQITESSVKSRLANADNRSVSTSTAASSDNNPDLYTWGSEQSTTSLPSSQSSIYDEPVPPPHPFPQPQTYSHFDDPDLLSLIDRTRSTLDEISALAQPVLAEQPLRTQNMLANQAKTVFDSYAKHGNEARLFESIGKFLNAGYEVEEIGTGQPVSQQGRFSKKTTRMSFAPVDGVKKDLPTRADESDKPYSSETSEKSHNEEALNRTKKIRRGIAIPPGMNLSGSNSIHRFEGAPPILKSSPTTLNTSVERTNLQSSNNDTSTTLATAETNPPSTSPSNFPHRFSVTTDATGNALLANAPFAPCKLTFSWDRDEVLTLPTGFFDHLNRIFHLYNREAAALLSYFTRRYSGSVYQQQQQQQRPGDVEPPHALFRLAISEHLNVQLDTILQPASRHVLGLAPATRRVLRDFFTGYKTSLNPVERDILARIARVDPQKVDDFWIDMTVKTRAWGALRVWCEARDREVVDRAKKEGWY